MFEKGDESVPSINPNPGYGARTIDFLGVIQDIHQESKEKAAQEPISTRIKRKRYSMPDTIETELTISSMFDPYFHVTNSGEMVDISRHYKVVGDVVSTLQSEYCGHTYNCHNEHCDKETTWY